MKGLPGCPTASLTGSPSSTVLQRSSVAALFRSMRHQPGFKIDVCSLGGGGTLGGGGLGGGGLGAEGSSGGGAIATSPQEAVRKAHESSGGQQSLPLAPLPNSPQQEQA